MDKSIEQWIDRNLEPSEPKIVAFDWRCNEIYENEEYYEYNGDFFKEDDLEEYARDVILSNATRQ